MPSIANLSFYYDRSSTISRMYRNAFRITNTYAGSNNIYFHTGYHYDNFFQALFTDPILSNENGDINIYMPNRNSLADNTDINWSPQLIILDGFSLEEGEDYQVVVTITYSEEFRMDQQIDLIFGGFLYNEVKQIKPILQPAPAGETISYGISFLDYGADIEDAFVMLHTGLMDPGTLTISDISVRQIIDNQYYPIANKNSWEMTRNTIKYSTDNGMTWTESTPDTELLCTLGENESVIIIGDNDSYYGDGFYSSQTCNVSGNIASLLSSTNFNNSLWLSNLQLSDGVFARLFNFEWPETSTNHELKVIDASGLKLPSTFNYSCGQFQGMFRGTPLVVAPDLPATTIGVSSYSYMFAECYDLAKVPDLPATNLSLASYYAMFRNCTSLVTPAKQADNPLMNDRLCYAFMYDGCTSLKSTPMFNNALGLVPACYMGMFRGCASLTMAPYLNATTIAPDCYKKMFKDCTNLQAAPYIAPISDYDYPSYYSDAYVNMFQNCTHLNYINYPVYEYNNSSWAYVDWVKNVAPTGIFVKAPTAHLWPINQDYGIPIGWTLINEGDVPEEDVFLTISQNVTYNDNTPAPPVASLSAYSLENVTYGSVRIPWGTTVTATASISSNDYEFTGWYEIDSEDNAVLVSTLSEYSFIITHNMNLVAYCHQLSQQETYYTYNVVVNPAGCGTASGGGSYVYGSSVVLSATPAENYDFLGWYTMDENNNKVLQYNIGTISFISGLTWPHNTTFYAEFEEHVTPIVYYQLSATIDPAGYGTVSGTGMYQENITATIIATPESGYKFLYWEEGGNILSYNSTYSLLMTSNHSLTAHFDLADENIIDYYSSKYFTIESLRDNNTILIDFGAGYANDYREQNHLHQIYSLSYDYSIDNGDTWNTVTIDDMYVASRDTSRYLGSPPNNMSILDYEKQFDPYDTAVGIPSNQNCFSITVNRGDTILIRANMPWYYYNGAWYDDNNNQHNIYMLPYFRVQSSDNTPRTFNLSGNILSLIKGSNFRNYTSFGYSVPNDLYDSLYYNTWQFFYFGAANSVSKLILPQETFPYCYQRMFKYPSQLNKPANCGVIDVPILSATTIEGGAYAHMFEWCTDITTAPELAATTLGDSCYEYMFRGCTSLVNPPELPATAITDYCYMHMFEGCASLTTAPELLGALQYNDNGTIKTYTPLYCYAWMFKGCTSLVNPPSILPAQYALSYACYAHMFEGCTSLTTAPELPAVSVGSYAYASMFEGCTSLTSITLPAIDIYDHSYDRISFGCWSLSSIRAYFTSWYDSTSPNTRGNNPNELYYYNIAYWNAGLPDNGSYYRNASANYDPITSACIPQNWTIYYVTP